MKSPGVVNYSSEPHGVELREVPRPVAGPDDIVLAVEAVGVCGSDLHQWTASHSWKVNYPVVLGHEFGGRIAELGSAVQGWKEGDRVVSETAAVIDPNSPLTREGLYNLEPSRKGFGYGVNGAMTRYVRVPARCLHRVPDGLAMEQAALTEPCCVAFNAVINNARVRPGDRVVVLGPGPIGILCAAMARLAGALGLPLLGGDLSRTDGPLTCAITALGRAPGLALSRRGARVSQGVWLTGPVGGSAAGLRVLQRDRPGDVEDSFWRWRQSLPLMEQVAVRAHLEPSVVHHLLWFICRG
jgi:hypothetical protein